MFDSYQVLDILLEMDRLSMQDDLRQLMSSQHTITRYVQLLLPMHKFEQKKYMLTQIMLPDVFH